MHLALTTSSPLHSRHYLFGCCTVYTLPPVHTQTLQEVATLASAGPLCPPRPAATAYAPAHAGFLAGGSQMGFHMVLAFEQPFNLQSNCTDARYSCLLAVGNGGGVQRKSAQQLDEEGSLYQVHKQGTYVLNQYSRIT